MANDKNTAAVVTALINPIVTELGYTLWDVEYVKEGSRQVLRVTIDAPQGININDCEAVHRAIDTPLDEADPIAESYYLEVSSPGLERNLRTDAHLAAYIGRTVTLYLFAPLAQTGGSKTLRGTLREVQADALCLTDLSGTDLTVPRDKISDARAYYDFENDSGADPAPETGKEDEQS